MGHRLVRALLALLTALSLAGTFVVPNAEAANIPMYDGNTARTRMVIDPSVSPTQLYLSSPMYLPLPGQSLSTPTVVGNTMYQYTYSGGTGTLYAINLPQINGSSVLTKYDYALPSFFTQSAKYAEHPIVFHPSQGAYGAQAQDSLTTSQGWQAIAVGRTLYAWPQGQWPASQSAVPYQTKIPSVHGNHRYQVDMNPLITPPVQVQVVNTQTGQAETVKAPLAVACSWDGGCVAKPLGLPRGAILLQQVAYRATQDFSSDIQAAITSDPVYIPKEPLFNGDPAVAFGVASWSHPRIELLDLITGRAKAIGTSGSSKIGAAIADAGMLATTSSGQYLVYHDEYGDVYTWNLDGAPSAAPIPSGSSTIQVAEDGAQTSPPYPGTTGGVAQPVVSKHELILAALPKTGKFPATFFQYENVSSPSTVYGAPVNPALCREATSTDNCRYVTAWSFSSRRFTALGGHMSNGPGIELYPAFGAGPNDVNMLNGSDFGNDGQFIAANISPYVGPVLDAGPEHYVMSWTNSMPDGGGAIILYAPVNYGVAASAPSSVASGATMTVEAKPVPSGITHDRIQGANSGICGTNDNPMTFHLTSSIGSSGYQPMTRTVAATAADPWSIWSGSYTLPPNTTGSSIKWTGTITAVDKYCTTATGRVTITELPESTSPPPPPPASGNGLTLDPNPALYGQNVTATLSPSAPAAPTPPQGSLVKWIWKIDASPTLSYPLKPSTWAFGFPVVATQDKTVPMTVSGGHSATASFMENWWDGGCQTLSGQCVWITNGFWLTGHGGPQYIPARTWPVKVSYGITEDYTYKWSTTTWTKNPLCATKNPPKDCNMQGQTPTTTVHKGTGSVALPTAQAQASLGTDGTAIDSVGGG